MKPGDGWEEASPTNCFGTVLEKTELQVRHTDSCSPWSFLGRRVGVGGWREGQKEGKGEENEVFLFGLATKLKCCLAV